MPDATSLRYVATDVEITDEMIERGAVALVNSDGTEAYERSDGRWRPAVLAEAVLRAALNQPDRQRASERGSLDRCR